MKRSLLKGLAAADPLVALLAVPAAMLLRGVRAAGVQRMPWTRQVLQRVGVFPIQRHYYEPLWDARALERPLEAPRHLPGIDWNEAGQLELLAQLGFAGELADLGRGDAPPGGFRFGNTTFESGDAEFLYQIIRHLRPRRIIEIGGGSSTRIIRLAVARNLAEEPARACEHVCVEPYENAWLATLPGLRLLRERVEHMPLDPFTALEADDLLFIDSSHVIRPQGDVLREYLEILPSLRPGVVVHVHDIFSPRDYLARWVKDEVRLWNEQYLLEALLSGGRNWRILAALNFLHHLHPAALRRCCPHLAPEREPGSIYLRKAA
jgi:hypothetical protein